jgi:hypothetical protein
VYDRSFNVDMRLDDWVSWCNRVDNRLGILMVNRDGVNWSLVMNDRLCDLVVEWLSSVMNYGCHLGVMSMMSRLMLDFRLSDLMVKGLCSGMDHFKWLMEHMSMGWLFHINMDFFVNMGSWSRYRYGNRCWSMNVRCWYMSVRDRNRHMNMMYWLRLMFSLAW